MFKSFVVTILGCGTSQGVPVIGCTCAVCCSPDPRDKRLRSSVMLTSEDSNVVIDTGPDFRQQMLREGVTKLDAVVYTHEHKDHVAGMDEVRAFNYTQRKEMPLYVTEAVEKALRREFFYAFEFPKYPGVPEVNLITIENRPFEVAGFSFLPIQVFHHHMPVLGFRIGDFTYITDANRIEPDEMEKLKGTKVLVINALRKQDHISHFNLREALEVIDFVAPEKAYLTHISHQLGLHAETEKELPPNVRLAFDGLRIEINP